MKPAGSLRTFADAVAIVTGGASGIGGALAEALAGRGALVALADLQIDLAKEIAARIRSGGGRATAEALDVTDFAATSRLVRGTFASAGRLDSFFNIAGIGIVGETRYYELEDWNRIVDVNLRGVVDGVQAAYLFRKVVERQRPMAPERFAEQALRAVARNRAIVLIPSWWRLIWWLDRLPPSLGIFVGRKALEAMKNATERRIEAK